MEVNCKRCGKAITSTLAEAQEAGYEQCKACGYHGPYHKADYSGEPTLAEAPKKEEKKKTK
jgi:translation initiation factor 2 beta subunit (eIF-2beta)/eIF-5